MRALALTASFLATATAWAQAPASGHACLMEPWARVEVRSTVEGRIAALHADRGATVARGQVLVELDTAAERTALEAAKYRAVMEGTQRSAETRLEAAREKLRRRDELVREKYIPAQDRDDAAAEAKVAEANLLEAKDNRRLAAIEERRLAELVEHRRIRSPVSGIVTERAQHVGEIVQTGESSRPILKIAQINPLRVEVVLPLTMMGKVLVGSTAEVAPEPPLSGRWQARVTVVDKVVDSASGTFGVRLELPNPKGEVPAGVKCRVVFK